MTELLENGVRDDAVLVLGGEAAAVEAVAREMLHVANGRVDSPEFVAAARDAWDGLPAPLRREVRRFRRHSGPRGRLLIRGLPVGDEARRTPSAADSVQREASVSAAILLMVACGLGDPAAYLQEKSGALVQDVVPVPGREEFQGNAGSVLLSFHTENAFHEHRPDHVMLMCLRTDHEGVAGTRTACVREVLDLLSPAARKTLSLPGFTTEAPPSFGAGRQGALHHPVLGGAWTDPDLRVDFAATRAATEEGAAALAELGALFERVSTTSQLLPGDLVIVDNHVTAHGRTAFTPRYDGRDRWLQRTFALTALRRSRGQRPDDGHVLVE
ncbi:TauD/TfdA family dioxygenase [Streptomyces sp. NBC_00704]|uniref:TauD/TfdA family dioxygenase n=1 Tax=Streptomyces sp. NBC_00704 TaxID=2975809 RepID=UPI002E324031|nr:TauD/TfdA family dioxygenase [Streptomyces sp. NBC_00704]